jgi:hypothetical protein
MTIKAKHEEWLKGQDITKFLDKVVLLNFYPELATVMKRIVIQISENAYTAGFLEGKSDEIPKFYTVQKLYVENLPRKIVENDLKELFSAYGPVHYARVIVDEETGRSKGFGFVELDSDKADEAIEALNDKEVGGRNLHISKTIDKN